MALIWTNTVPRRLIKRKIRVQRVAALGTTTATVSSKSYVELD